MVRLFEKMYIVVIVWEETTEISKLKLKILQKIGLLKSILAIWEMQIDYQLSMKVNFSKDLPAITNLTEDSQKDPVARLAQY